MPAAARTRFTGRTALVTGGGSGLGAATAGQIASVVGCADASDALACLRKGRDRAQGLVQLMRNAAGHLSSTAYQDLNIAVI